MKKNYILAFTAFVFTAFSVNAQFTDNFEAYPVDPYHGGNWSSWGGTAGAEDIIVSTTYAFDGSKSGKISGTGAQDAILRLGNKTSGVYNLSFQVYIPTGKSGYMNFQGTTTAAGGTGGGGAGVFNSPNLIFNNVLSASGAPGLGGAYGNVDDPTAIYTWTFPQGTWFPIVISFNLDTGFWTMSINGNALPAKPFDDEIVLGGIDFYSFDTNNEMYLDAIIFSDALSVDESSLNLFNAYPNPVKDYLYLSSQATVDLVEVYDILGHNIMSINPNAISPKVDMSNLASGTYLVKVTIGNQSKTMKIIK